MRRLWAILAVLTLAALEWQALELPARADQTDPRLDALFADLKSAPDEAAAAAVDREIWRIWLEHPDKRTRESVLIGISFMNDGRAELAELAFKEAIERSPDFAEAWNRRATLRFVTGDLEGSVADCAHVLSLEPRHYGALSGLGQIYAKREKWEAAAHWFRQALAVNPNMPAVQAVLELVERLARGQKT